MLVQTDYGDEVGGRTPWELFDESDARQSLLVAEEAVGLADAVIRALKGNLLVIETPDFSMGEAG